MCLAPTVFLVRSRGKPRSSSGCPPRTSAPSFRALQVGGPGHYIHIGPELALPGEWVITVRERISEFEETTVDVPIDVNS